MELTLTGRSFIERQEWAPRSSRCGWVAARNLYFPYRDYRGFWTFGPGMLILDGKSGPGEFANGRTEDQVNALFTASLTKYVAAVNRLNDRLKAAGQKPLDPWEFDPWTSFAWNEGTGALEPYNANGSVHNSAVVALLQGRRSEVPTLLLRWDVSAGQHDPNLHHRREAEGYVMTHPYSDDHNHDDAEHRIDYLGPVLEILQRAPQFDLNARLGETERDWAREAADAASGFVDEPPTQNDLRSSASRELDAIQARPTLPPDDVPPTQRNT